LADLFRLVRNQEGINLSFQRAIAVGERLEFGFT
jgi:hypothetical protein